MSGEPMKPPAAVVTWAVKGLGGVLGLVEEMIRAGGRPDGETVEYLRMYADRLTVAAAGEPIPAGLREPADYWAWKRSAGP